MLFDHSYTGLFHLFYSNFPKNTSCPFTPRLSTPSGEAGEYSAGLLAGGVGFVSNFLMSWRMDLILDFLF